VRQDDYHDGCTHWRIVQIGGVVVFSRAQGCNGQCRQPRTRLDQRERENGANDVEYLRYRMHWTELQCCLFSHGNVSMYFMYVTASDMIASRYQGTCLCLDMDDNRGT
jgi:hypothetical protein